MGWVTDDGQHEGYLVPEFADGVRGSGTTGGGVPNDQVIVDMIWDDEPEAGWRHVTRPAGEVIAWRVMCDCTPPIGARSQWASAKPIARVPSQALEDLAARRMWADDENVPYASERTDVEDVARGIWWTEHAGRHDALGHLEAAVAAEAAARTEVNRQALQARMAGATWDQIGRAAGITRQSAHDRWAGQDLASGDLLQ